MLLCCGVLDGLCFEMARDRYYPDWEALPGDAYLTAADRKRIRAQLEKFEQQRVREKK